MSDSGHELSSIAFRLGEILDLKNKAYGDSAGKAGEILHILYPAGISPWQYNSVLLVVRILDKLSRISTGILTDEDPWMDIAGYGVLGVRMMEEKEVEWEQAEMVRREVEEERARDEAAAALEKFMSVSF